MFQNLNMRNTDEFLGRVKKSRSFEHFFFLYKNSWVVEILLKKLRSVQIFAKFFYSIEFFPTNKSFEASSHDQINMTKFWLEYDWKVTTMMNLNNWIWPKNLTMMNLTDWKWLKFFLWKRQTLTLPQKTCWCII